MIARYKIPAHQLREGMYVAELDRPWLDTPFLFQGFLIRSEREVEELCRFCQWVWVDRQRSETDIAALIQGRTAPGLGIIRRILRSLSGKQNTPSEVMNLRSLDGLAQQDYPDQKTPMRDELPRASDSLSHAEEMVREATEQLRLSDTLRLSVINKAVDPIIESVLRNKDAMIWLQSMRGKDDYVFSRSVACSVWGVIFGRHLGLDRTTLGLLATGGLLLDLGKVQLPDELLTRTGPLSRAEMDLVREHVSYGVEMLERSGDFDPRVVEMVRTHHERFNGSGYPSGLRGTEIPALGKIAGILDSFVAMTSQRPYADAMATYDVMRHLNEQADVEFQGELVEQFIQAIGMFPTGSLVELSNGQVAVVTEQNRVQRLRPKVMIVLGEDKKLLKKFKTYDLRDAKDRALWITMGLPPGSYGIDPQEFFL